MDTILLVKEKKECDGSAQQRHSWAIYEGGT